MLEEMCARSAGRARAESVSGSRKTRSGVALVACSGEEADTSIATGKENIWTRWNMTWSLNAL